MWDLALNSGANRVSVSKFKAGPTVDFFPSLRGLAAAARLYKITRVMPTEGREHLYRIMTIDEAFERVDRESELVAASGLLITRDGKMCAERNDLQVFF